MVSWQNRIKVCMETFIQLAKEKESLLQNELSRHILEMFSQIFQDYIFQRRNARKPNSNLIKYNLVNLGHKLGYRVYANGLNENQKKEQWDKYKFVCREFLYDVHWYLDIEGKFYTPETVRLVAESELGDTRKGDISGLPNPAIKFDFQKLLVANAELRLMIFKVYKFKFLSELNDYFNYAIREYGRLQTGDCFLFICLVHETKQLYFAEKMKQ